MKIDVERKWTARIELDEEEAELVEKICFTIVRMMNDEPDPDDEEDETDMVFLSDFDLEIKHQELARKIRNILHDQLLEGRG
jgi:hypothetical protein